MAMTKDQYRQMLQALLPTGKAWLRAITAKLTDLLDAFAAELERLDGRAQQLIEESDIYTTTELLPDWEHVAGLPDNCTTLASTVQQRRNNLVTKIAGRRANDTQYYLDVAAQLGYTITIDDLITPYEAGHLLNGVEITPAEWVFVWRVNASEETPTWARCASSVCGDPIRAWGDELLECIINKLRPAHTHVLFSYT